MQHVRIALYTVKPGTVDDTIRKAQEGMLPIFRAQPGFVGYGLVKTGDDALISISAWQTSEQADAANQTAGQWVKENVADVFLSVQNHVGDLHFFSSAGQLGG
jgi:heme-degrading monooxygenase HmoA